MNKTSAPMERALLFDFDSAVLHPEEAVQNWIRNVDDRSKVKVSYSGGSLVVVGDEQLVTRLVIELDGQKGPQHLIWAVVPDGGGDVRRIRGGSYEQYMKRLSKSPGRTTRLNALPTELGETYWQSMTHPDYARED